MLNTYSFDECTLGRTESFESEITADMMDKFRELSGDINPLHCDEQFALEKGYAGRVVYGMLSASFFSTLVGVYIPGEKCLIHEVSYKFMKPVYIWDKLIVTGEVIDRDERSNQLVIKVRIRRISDNALVVRGRMIVGVQED